MGRSLKHPSAGGRSEAQLTTGACDCCLEQGVEGSFVGQSLNLRNLVLSPGRYHKNGFEFSDTLLVFKNCLVLCVWEEPPLLHTHKLWNQVQKPEQSYTTVILLHNIIVTQEGKDPNKKMLKKICPVQRALHIVLTKLKAI